MYILTIGLIFGIAISNPGIYRHPTSSTLQDRKPAILTLPDIAVDADLSLFVYAKVPAGSKVSIALYKPTALDQTSRLESASNISKGEWLTFEFGKAKPGWGERVTVNCEVDSAETSAERRRTWYLFTQLSDKAVPEEKLNQNGNTRFEVNPVISRDVKSGRFVYAIPWPAQVTIFISKRTKNGIEPTGINIQDQKDSEGIAETTWDSNKSFESIADGEYEARVECKEIVPDSKKGFQKNVFVLIEFKRGPK